MYYLQGRYYNPEWGRFINADAITGAVSKLLSHNMFSYCLNNPINLQDQSGFSPSYRGELNSGFVWRAITPENAARLEKGLSIQARNMTGKLSVRDHVLKGSDEYYAKKSPWISTSFSEEIAKEFDSGEGYIKIDLSKVFTKKINVVKEFFGDTKVAQFFRQKEVSIYQSVSYEAVVEYKGPNSNIRIGGAPSSSLGIGGTVGSSVGLDMDLDE